MKLDTKTQARKCSIDGCPNNHIARGWCHKHWNRWKRNGSPHDLQSSYKLIPLLNGGMAIVDKDDYERVRKLRWSHKVSGTNIYAIAVAKKTFKQISMHRFLLRAKNGEIVDHKNRHGLDNRKANLRIVSSQQNRINTSPVGLASRYKGVTRDSTGNLWIARIRPQGKAIYLGCFDREEDAAKAYDDAAKKEYGDYSYVNFPK